MYPQTMVQTCIVHLIRNSLAFVAWKDRKAILPAIKAIYRAENADMALVRLEEFKAEWAGASATPRLARPGAAPEAGDSVPPASAKRGRGVAAQLAQDHQDRRQLSQRGRGVEAALPRNHGGGEVQLPSRSERYADLNQIDGFQNRVAFIETAADDPSSGS